ncbi:MAG TPA: 50S ribosomal protein L11 methyltransferase [Acidimicrobiales bacterium]|nr:50S ribosomal protein L11 methyltransferase [Acidimicrobiales bacterium]
MTARTVQVTVPAVEADLAADALWQAGAAAIEERPAAGASAGVVVLVAAAPGGDPDPGPLLAAVSGRWPAEVVAVDVETALDAWRDHARPVVVGDRLVVRLAGEPGPGTLVVDPGRSFGSGAHPSTLLVLEALVELVAGGERVLDVGSGSGILALAALALGAAEALAVDIDPAAQAATAANAERNGLAGRVTVAEAVSGRHDLVVANLLLPDHRALAPAVAAAVAGGGTLVVSGVLAEQRDAVAGAYGAAGLVVVGERRAEGWLTTIWRPSRRMCDVRDAKSRLR